MLEVSNNLQNTVEEIRVEVDREKASAQGLAPYQIAQSVNNMTRGSIATHIIGKYGEVFAVNVVYDKRYHNDIDSLKKLKLRTPTGLFVTLDEVASIRIEQAVSSSASIRRIQSLLM